jgi:hypothetical protein
MKQQVDEMPWRQKYWRNKSFLSFVSLKNILQQILMSQSAPIISSLIVLVLYMRPMLLTYLNGNLVPLRSVDIILYYRTILPW